MYLNAHTYFSLRHGTLSPQELVEAARAMEVKVLALTDINNTSAALDFAQTCQQNGIKPVLGIEFRDAQHQPLFIGIARNNAGWEALCRLLTEHTCHGKPLLEVAPPTDDVFIVYPREVKPMSMLRPYEFVGVPAVRADWCARPAWRNHMDKLVVWQPITFLDNEGYRLHKLLRAIDTNALVTRLDPEQIDPPWAHFKPEKAIREAFAAYPEAIRNTRRLLDQCSIRFDTGLHRNRQTFTGTPRGDLELLTKLAQNGCQRRYGSGHRCAQERVQRELQMIASMHFTAYFLITWDIIRYAQSAGYHHVGRGSGANSIVAYCLYITDVEPLELDLYFERFINPRRSTPPDFDIDFSWDERDDVTDYIFKRYGRDHTALLATYNTFQPAAIIRETSKALGLTKPETDAIAQYHDATSPGSGHWTGRRAAQDPTTPPQPQMPRATHPLFSALHPWAKHILRYAERLANFPNYLSIHAGGIIIAEKPLFEATALQMMPKGFPTTQFDMYAAETWGFHKFDVLSQRGLGHIKTCIDLVRENQGLTVNVHDIDRIKTDEHVRTQLRASQCMGCFYIESPAMRGLLRKLRCDQYVHLVAASSIIRPGVAQSGMMRTYIQRFHQPNSFEYPHPVFKEHLSETFGVMVYQEDVMKILHHFAGLGLDEADVMRRMMTGKKRSSQAFERLRQQYIDQCDARGYAPELTQEVWRQIESFAGYSFCKAHSASFAVESLQSLYLKAHFPLEFMVAVINNFGGFYSTEFYVHEARMCGATIHPPCVNNSRHLTRIIGKNVYLGFVHLHGLETQVARDIEQQRNQYGPFRSLSDFLRRVRTTPTQLDILIRIGAFRFTDMQKSALMWEKVRVLGSENGLGANLLFAETTVPSQLPALIESPFDQAFDELELLGFPLCSPFDLLDDDAKQQHPGIAARDMENHTLQLVTMTGYFVCRKATRTVKGDLMYFGTWLDAEGRFFDTVHFPDQLKHSPFRGAGTYRIYGRLVSDFGFVSLETKNMTKLPYRTDERYA
jgi:DNA polymerase-3 subunit alpha